MFDQLEKAIERENRKIDGIPVVTAYSVDDIKRIVAELDPINSHASKNIDLSAIVNATEDGKNVAYKVSAPTRSRSRREMLIDGLNVIKNQTEIAQKADEDNSIEVNGVVMKQPKLGSNDKGKFWVDPLIKRWFGGYRDGLMICWDVCGYKYFYNAFEHKLHREKHE